MVGAPKRRKHAKPAISHSDQIFLLVVYVLLGVSLVSVVYPLYFVVIASFSDPNAVAAGEVWLVPRRVSLEGYRIIFAEEQIWVGYRNTIFYTTLGTVFNVAITLPAAYVLSRSDLKGRKFFMVFVVVLMFFRGGIVPTYLVVRGLGLVNTFAALILVEGVVIYYLIIGRAFFESSIPTELFEAAIIDGASEFNVFFRIVVPLSKVLISIYVLLYGVFHWNDYFNGLLYVVDENKYPLQLVLRSILIQNEAGADLMSENVETMMQRQRVSGLIRYGIIIVSSVPMLILYPFLQRYFIQGVMIGAVKG
jgi:putative aldouronate transport system permease protein